MTSLFPLFFKHSSCMSVCMCVLLSEININLTRITFFIFSRIIVQNIPQYSIYIRIKGTGTQCSLIFFSRPVLFDFNNVSSFCVTCFVCCSRYIRCRFFLCMVLTKTLTLIFAFLFLDLSSAIFSNVHSLPNVQLVNSCNVLPLGVLLSNVVR